MIQGLAFILGTTLMYATPLIYAAMGGVISENSGVINIGLEGMMTMGAFAASAVACFTGNPYLSFLAGGLTGAFFGLIHALVSISFHANQTVSGVAINFLAPGLSLFLCRKLFNGAAMTRTIELHEKLPKYLADVFPPNSFWHQVFNQDIGVYVALVTVALLWFLLYRTRFGLRVRAIGEHPRAADTLGVSVAKYRYLCVIASGFLAGLGGGSLSIGVSSTFFNNTVCGQGFIAMAAMIFGKWKPHGALGACLVFGAANAMVVFLGYPGRVNISSGVLSMLPYVLTLVILVLFVGRSNAPAADGIPYEKA